MKTYRIAGITFGIHFHYDEYLKHNIEAYASDEQKMDHVLSVQLSDIIEHPRGETQSIRNPYVMYQENKRIIYIKDKNQQIKSLIKHDMAYQHVNIMINPSLNKNAAEIEYTWLGLMFMEIAIKHKLLPMHAAAINDHGHAILVSAPSQTGKSTHARLWKMMDDKVEILNDDKPLIGLKDGRMMVFSSPFSGKTSLNQNMDIPLKALVFLYQGKENMASLMERDDIIKEMMKNMMRPSDEASWDDILGIIEEMIEKLPIYKFEATPKVEAAYYLKKIIDKGE